MPVANRLPPALVIEGGVVGIAAARSLSAAGIEVHGIGDREDPLRFSRCRKSFTAIPSGAGRQAAALRWLERGSWPGGVLLPCSDDALELIATNRDRLEELGYRTTEADDEVLLGMLDKQKTYELCRGLGVGAPLTANVVSRDEAREAAGEIGYPCALKPVYSHRFAPHFGFTQKALVARSEAELDLAFSRTQEHSIEMIVTEIIPGPDDSYASYYGYMGAGGEPLLGLTKRKLRQFPIQFGIGSFHVTDANPEVAELGLRFLQGVGLRGLGCVEFKRDSRDGLYKLIECNHRLTAATQQLVKAGADLPLFCYSRVAGIDPPSTSDFRSGVGFWFPLNDFRAMLSYRRHGELTLGSWVRSLMRRQSLPLASLRDPLPSLIQMPRRLLARWLS